VADNAVVSVRTPDRKNHVWKLRRGLNWLILWSNDGFVIYDSDALAGFIRGMNIFSRGERHIDQESSCNVEFSSLHYDATPGDSNVNRHSH